MIYQPGILVGRITKIHGYAGTVTIKLEKVFIENISKMESVYLEVKGIPVPFFISEYEYNGGDILKLGFEGYDTYDKVLILKGCRVFLTEKDKTRPQDETDENITGFTVILSDNSTLGIIKEVIENPSQWLLRIETAPEKEVLVPFHEDLISGIDRKGKIIQMDIPEGLTDIN